jgi:hypothetical protein
MNPWPQRLEWQEESFGVTLEEAVRAVRFAEHELRALFRPRQQGNLIP